MNIDQRFIAQKTGVSQKTVSQYLRFPDRVSEATGNKIKRAMEKYGYHTNFAARSMRSRIFRRITCLVIQHVDVFCDPLPYHPRYVSESYFGVLSELEDSGYSGSLEVYMFDRQSGNDLLVPQSLREICSDGIIGIMATAQVPQKVDSILGQLKIPVVWVNRGKVERNLRSIIVEEKNTAMELVAALCQDYKSRDVPIVWFGPETDGNNSVHYSSIERLEGVCEEGEKAKRKVEVCFTTNGIALQEQALQIFKYPKVRCIICYNDSHILAAMSAAMRLGIKVPQDVEITGFSARELQLPMRRFVQIPDFEIGQNAAKYLLEAVNNKNVTPKMLTPVKSRYISL